MIKIKNLRFRYAGAKYNAIDGINLTIPKGKYIAILGHNGSGKSTFSKLLVGLYKPTEGEIELDGIKIAKNTLIQVRQKIGMVFQNPENQFIGSTVEDDIAFGLENKGIAREEMQKIVYKYADQVNMVSFLRQEPANLSGGQKQRVAIASTLALDPSIIIFDESTSMLDPKGKKDVLEIIRKVQKDKSKTLISVTHNMNEAVMADEIIVFAKGKIIAQGDPKQILKNKKIVDIAKIDAPFIYKVSEKMGKYGIKPTYNKKTLIGEICR